MTTHAHQPKNFTGSRPKRPRGPGTGKQARMAMFARLWVGTIAETVNLCRAEGMSICTDTAAAYLRDPQFIGLMRSAKSDAPGSGVWTREELQRHLSRVTAGIEADGAVLVRDVEPIIPGENDYDAAKGGAQFRKTEREVIKFPRMADRLHAADLLGKTIGAFLDRVELTGDAKISVVELLDDDLRPAKPVVDCAVTEPLAIVDNDDAEDLAGLR